MKYFFLTVLVILAACQSQEPPEDLLDRQEMILVLTEVHLLEAKIDEIPVVPSDSKQAVYNHYEEKLFNDLGITQEQYETSFTYYLRKPKEFEKIYSVVVDSLLQKEKTLKK